MSTKHVFNDGPGTLFVAGRMIPPGEGRDVPVHLLSASQRGEEAAPTPEAAPEPSLDELLAELLAHPVKHIAEQLPSLTEEALQRLDMLAHEEAVPRKTLLTAIGEEKVRRAEERFQAEMDAEHQRNLAKLTPEQLAELGESQGQGEAGAAAAVGTTPPASEGA